MSRYFSKLAKRSGIILNNAAGSRHLSTRVGMRPSLQQKKTEPAIRGLEVNIRKTVTSPPPRQNAIAESTVRKESKRGLQSSTPNEVVTSSNTPTPGASGFIKKDNVTAQSLKTEFRKKVGTEDSPEVRLNGAPHTGNGKKNKQLDDMAKAENQILETSGQVTARGNEKPDMVMARVKRSRMAGPERSALSQNHFTTSELSPGAEILLSDRQSSSEEKNIEIEAVSSENQSRKASESGDDSFFEPMPHAQTSESPSIPSATIEATENSRSFTGGRAIHIVSERGEAVESKTGKAETPGHDNSVDIHIGTISFEVHQAPEKKTVTETPTPAPSPVVIQQPQSAPMPRLSRYYLRGV